MSSRCPGSGGVENEPMSHSCGTRGRIAPGECGELSRTGEVLRDDCSAVEWPRGPGTAPRAAGMSVAPSPATSACAHAPCRSGRSTARKRFPLPDTQAILDVALARRRRRQPPLRAACCIDDQDGSCDGPGATLLGLLGRSPRPAGLGGWRSYVEGLGPACSTRNRADPRRDDWNRRSADYAREVPRPCPPNCCPAWSQTFAEIQTASPKMPPAAAHAD